MKELKLKWKLMLLVLLVMGEPTLSETYVGGFILSDANWNLAGSPYIVQESIGIIDSTTLTIEPGVEVRFNPNRSLVVDTGTLIARGTEALPVRFTANQGNENPWAYLQFSDGAADTMFDASGNYLSGSVVEYTIIEYAGSTSFEGAIRVISSSPYIHNSVFQNNAKGGIYGYRANSLRIERNSITNNTSEGYYGGGIVLEYCNSVFLSNNTLEYNYRGLEVLICNSLTLKDNMICENYGGGSGTGVYFYGSDYGNIIGNIINGNDHNSGVHLYYCDFFTLTRNIISNNTALGGAGMYLRRCNYLTFKQNIITENSNTFLEPQYGIHGAAIYAENSDNITFSGDRITYNHAAPGKSGGIYITDGSDGWNFTGPNTLAAVQIYGNDNYQLYNNNSFGGSFSVNAPGNVDARQVYWGTNDEAEIKAGIYDFFDDVAKGVVFYDPYSLPPPGDMDSDCDVDLFDYVVFASAWRSSPSDENWNSACDISEPNDGFIDFKDLDIFVSNWLYDHKF